MGRALLEGNWINPYIRTLLEDEEGKVYALNDGSANHTGVGETKDATEEALQVALTQAKKMVDATQSALDIYKSFHGHGHVKFQNGATLPEATDGHEDNGGINGGKRRGVTSRELSGEMGGDTRN